MSRRVLVTGIGITCGLGTGSQACSDALRGNTNGIRRLTLFDADGYGSRWAGQVLSPLKDLQLEAITDSARVARITRTERLAFEAALEAVGDAELTADQLAEAGLFFGSGGGDCLAADALRKEDLEHDAIAWELITRQPANAANLLAHGLGIGGPRTTTMTACSSGALAIGLGLDMIRLGRVDRAIVGGADALSPLTFGGFSALRAIDPDPCRPFHAERRGLTLGEGAAVLVLEAEDVLAAGRRSAESKAYAELAGYGVSADAYHPTTPAPDGRGALASMSAALRDAGAMPEQVDYINAHGTATIHNDRAEATAISRLFQRPVAVSSTKAATGHALSAAGALEVAICVLAIAGQFLPPTLRLDRPDPDFADLDLVALHARDAPCHVAMSNSFAFGGHNTTVVVRAHH